MYYDLFQSRLSSLLRYAWLATSTISMTPCKLQQHTLLFRLHALIFTLTAVVQQSGHSGLVSWFPLEGSISSTGSCSSSSCTPSFAMQQRLKTRPQKQELKSAGTSSLPYASPSSLALDGYLASWELPVCHKQSTSQHSTSSASSLAYRACSCSSSMPSVHLTLERNGDAGGTSSPAGVIPTVSSAQPPSPAAL